MLAEDEEAVTWPPSDDPDGHEPSGPNITHMIHSEVNDWSANFRAAYFGPLGITFYRFSTDYNKEATFFLTHTEAAEMIAAYQKALTEAESNGQRRRDDSTR